MNHDSVCLCSRGFQKTQTSTGRLIPLNQAATNALACWAARFPSPRSDDYVFPSCKFGQTNPTRPTKGWRTAWRHALKRAGVRIRFHDLRHAAITKLSESQASEQTILAIAGHVSRRMLEHYSHVRLQAKRAALESISTPEVRGAVHQNVHQIGDLDLVGSRKLLN